MNKKPQNQITYWLGVAAVGLVIGFGIQFAMAGWNNPPANPPGTNVGAPINTGSGTQTKAGNLVIGGAGNLETYNGTYLATAGGNVGIGTPYPTQKLEVSGNIKGTQLCIGNDCRSAWPSSGSVGGGDITGVAAGTGLSGGGTSGDVTLSVNTASTQSRVTGNCSPGSSIRVVAQDGTVTCETDDGGALGQSNCYVSGGVGWGGPTSVDCNVGYYVAGVQIEDTTGEIAQLKLKCCR